MRYEIKCKSDSLTGAALVVKVPENELDKKALHTIQADKPEFILPFRSRSVDESIEFVYQIGLNNKLQYLTGRRRPKEYAELWSSLLSPLLDCGDWFMKPYSFVLSAEFLYYDKGRKTASYVYVPTVNDSSDYGDLREMAAEVSKLISVADPNLENRVLRAVMKDFDPQEFLNMLKAYVEEAARAMAAYQAQAGFAAPGAAARMGPPAQVWREAPAAPARLPAQPPAQPPARPPIPAERENADGQVPAPGDAIIEIPDKGPSKKKSREKATKDKSKGGKKAAEAEKQGNPHGFFGKKKGAQYPAYPYPPAPMGRGAPAPIGCGAPAPMPQYPMYPYPPAPMNRSAPAQMNRGAPVPMPQYPMYPYAPAPMGRGAPVPMPQYPMYPPALMGRGAPAPIAQYPMYQPAYAPAAYASAIAPLAAQAARPAPNCAPGAPCADARDNTQSVTVAAGEARLRFIGRGPLPLMIGIKIKEGEIFTIGRYDSAVGGQQSSFEFDRAAKAVSRRHAVVERDAEGYKIIDLASSAGTFLNGQKLPPNTPRDLEQGCHVSFGNCGADYVWEK